MFKNAPLGLAALILLAASLLFLWFVILAGVSDVTPLKYTYFLQADTDGITGARPVSRWTYFYVCGAPDNADCGSAHPAPPFGKFAWDRDPQNAPDALVGSHGSGTTSFKYYYMWRFGWVFLLLTLFFETLSFFTGFLACCGRLGAAISFLLGGFALFLYSIGAALTTATFVMARDQFKDDGRDANIGRWAFGFLWGSYAGLLISVVLFALGMRKDRNAAAASGAAGGRRRFWGRRSRSTRSRSYDGRRVKDDYS
ncbi:Eisosomes component [Purpureocillium takamizusanense]|uniref:Eisosomes component n=1 Tax=Purpureocillium takamizusanense TaxID=2060973 RepID=A0A9Q8VGP0_9HYPO|nr:Eisosomes component [Purpureocillium takamizusanense]UNI23987.1 Eisosomes component [Purpureocillium takamizusanense]